MARTFTLLFVVLATTLSSFAQKINFNDTGNVWIICSLDPYEQRVDKYGNTFRPSSARGIAYDTIVNGYTYYAHTRFGWIRNDSTGKKFYRLQHPDSTEKLFMDYTLNVGDTLYFNGSTFPSVLKKIDSVQVNGVYHLLFEYTDGYILEGIGPCYGNSWAGEARYLKVCCFMHNGVHASIVPTPWFYYGCALSVDDATHDRAWGTVIPNPVTSASRITLPKTITEGNLVITNALGQTVSSRRIRNEINLPLPEALPAGLYFYTVTSTTSDIKYSGKFTAE